ncbi:hypothetical protein DV702_15310 [Sporosarcina sp. PTS2304]|uniref:hypothetical protein n=1 Tax=Sporosarcina sp. PTS2304 TaxID=2283194 RepID=UPI000E0CFA70|nr:hypothetical protein [Sporosarcina sp. PTS2304]AXI00957.1 hypothetical protein DV702_15310 [Sporosarcina sp. PTS2304]
MTTFSFLILSEKSSLIEKDRYNKHSFVKKEGNFYIFARQQTAGIVEGKSISREYIDFIRSISSEMESPIYTLVKELKNKEGENDFSIKKYIDSNGIIDSEKVLVLNKDTLISYNKLYKFPFITSEITRF